MPNITEANYPTEDGWNHVEIEIKKGEEMTGDAFSGFMAFLIDGFTANLEDFDTVVGEQEGMTLKGCIRRREAAAA